MFSRAKIPAYAIGFITLALTGLGVGALISTPPEPKYHQGPVYQPDVAEEAVPSPSKSDKAVTVPELPLLHSKSPEAPTEPSSDPTPSKRTEPVPSNSPRASIANKPQPRTGGRGSGQPKPQTVTGQPDYVSPPPSNVPITPTETSSPTPEPTGSEQ